jgi:hypothetical protein
MVIARTVGGDDTEWDSKVVTKFGMMVAFKLAFNRER